MVIVGFRETAPTETDRRIKHRLRKVWRGMHSRCDDPRAKDYPRYGGKGLTIVSEWATFQPFYEWAIKAGYQEGLQLDRRDNSRGYSPDNCRFATRSEQQNNKHNNVTLACWGETKTVAEWARDPRCQVKNTMTIRHRIEHGWDALDILTTPSLRTPSYKITCWGITKTCSEWTRDSRCAITNESTLRLRSMRGWQAEAALTTPSQRKKQYHGGKS